MQTLAQCYLHILFAARRKYQRVPIFIKFVFWALVVVGATVGFAGGLVVRGAHASGGDLALRKTIEQEVDGHSGVSTRSICHNELVRHDMHDLCRYTL